MTLKEKLEMFRRTCNELTQMLENDEDIEAYSLFGAAEFKLETILEWCDEEEQSYEYYDDLFDEFAYPFIAVEYGVSEVEESGNEKVIEKAKKLYDEMKKVVEYLKKKRDEF